MLSSSVERNIRQECGCGVVNVTTREKVKTGQRGRAKQGKNSIECTSETEI
jgi:hypothetical protein